MTCERKATGVAEAASSMISGTEMWRMPAILFANWWNMMLAPWLPGLHPAHVHGAHDRLVVPPPLKDMGEHALFA